MTIISTEVILPRKYKIIVKNYLMQCLTLEILLITYIFLLLLSKNILLH